MGWRLPAGLAATAALAVVAFGTSRGGAGANVLRPDDPQVISAGRDVYMEHRASSYGEDLEGQPDWRSPGPDRQLPAPPHDATGHTWHLTGST